jgi:polysaccharide deacetylase family protein (PEP-CTERM system associated)
MNRPSTAGLLLSVDFEGAASGLPVGPQSPLPRQTERLLRLLDEVHARATFFVVGEVARQFPRLVAQIANEGHEIGVHSDRHIPLPHLTPSAFREDTARAIESVSQACGAPVVGYRAPFFSVTEQTTWAWEILSELGFRYDSSVNPVRSPVFGYPEHGAAPSRLPSGLWEIPVPVCARRGFGLPVGGGTYLRLLPSPFLRWVLDRRLAQGLPFCAYVHPYDFDPTTGYQPVFGRNALFNLLLLAGRRSAHKKLKRLVRNRTPYRLVDYLDTVLEPVDPEVR